MYLPYSVSAVTALVLTWLLVAEVDVWLNVFADISLGFCSERREDVVEKSWKVVGMIEGSDWLWECVNEGWT